MAVCPGAWFLARLLPIPGPISPVPDDVDRDLNRRNRSPVLKPVCGVPILGPAHSWSIVRRDSVAMVRDRPFQYVDDAGSVFVVVNRAEDAPWFDGHHAHSQLAPCHALDFRAKVNRRQNFDRTVTPFGAGAFCSLLIVLSSN
jgi:hypothetical protein